MASRLIKIRLPFLFLFCLEMFKENCPRMSGSLRTKKASVSGGSRGDPSSGDTSEKSKIRKFFFL